MTIFKYYCTLSIYDHGKIVKKKKKKKKEVVYYAPTFAITCTGLHVHSMLFIHGEVFHFVLRLTFVDCSSLFLLFSFQCLAV